MSVYQHDSDGSLTQWGQAITTTSTTRTQIGNQHIRKGLSANGGNSHLLLVESTIYSFQNAEWVPLGNSIDFLEASSTILQDGSVVAIANASSNAIGWDCQWASTTTLFRGQE
jgi:hypothetical protein